MKLKMFTVFDSKAEAYLSPFFMQSTGQAIRSFADAVNDPQTQFNRHPSDFTLMEIGDYDDSTGDVTSYATKLNLGLAHDFKKQQTLPFNQATPA